VIGEAGSADGRKKVCGLHELLQKGGSLFSFPGLKEFDITSLYARAEAFSVWAGICAKSCDALFRREP
jgi:hypothetical protein